MRILVVGAGALGGYFGARLLAAGRDVIFLVRPRRAEQLASTGLAVRSRFGDLDLGPPPVVTADRLDRPYDLVLLGCKAYDLDDAMASIAPAVGPDTAILPLLNGMAHLDSLDARFGAERVLGGLCLISATLDSEGRILHLNDFHGITFGERDGRRSPRAEAILAALTGAGFTERLSDQILLEMWEKWIFIAAIAGITCLLRAPVGAIVAAGGSDLALALTDECAAVAAANGFPLRPPALERCRAAVTQAGSPLTASMLRDLEQGGRIEADHILGDLLRRGNPQGPDRSLLRLAYTGLKAYEARRA